MAVTTPYDPLVLNQIDIGKKKGYLGSPLFDSINEQYLALKPIKNEYRSKRNSLQNELRVIKKRYEKSPNNPSLIALINEIQSEIYSLNDSYRDSLSKFSFIESERNKYAKLKINDTLNITGVMIDKFPLRHTLYDYRSYLSTLLNRDLDSEIKDTESKLFFSDLVRYLEYLNPFPFSISDDSFVEYSIDLNSSDSEISEFILNKISNTHDPANLISFRDKNSFTLSDKLNELKFLHNEQIKLKKWLLPFMPNWDVKNKSFPENFHPETFKEYVEYHLKERISKDYKKYGLKKPPYYVNNKHHKSLMIKLEFESGIILEIKKEVTIKKGRYNPPYTIVGGNVIEIANNLSYNYTPSQNNYVAFSKFLDVVQKEFTKFYVSLFPNGESLSFPLGIKELLNLSVPSLIPIGDLEYASFDSDNYSYPLDYSKFLIDNPELNINLIFPTKREQMQFQKVVGLICRYWNPNEESHFSHTTDYFGGKTFPETKVYDKDSHIYEVHGKDIGYFVTRIEIDCKKPELVKKSLSSLDPSKSKSRSLYSANYYHPNDPNGSHLTSMHKEALFNSFIDQFFYQGCVFTDFLDLVRSIKDNSDLNIIDVVKKDNDLMKILELLYHPMSSSDLIYYSDLKKSTLDRRLSKLKGLVAYNSSTKKYGLTIVGALILHDCSSLLQLYYYLNKSLSPSNTISQQTSLTSEDISSFLFPILKFLLIPKIKKLGGCDPNGT